MKKTLLLSFSLITIILTSCHSTKFTHSGNVNSRLNLMKGKWLLNRIDAPLGVRYDLNEIVVKEFRSMFGDRFLVINTTLGILTPDNISNNPSKAVLSDIKNGTGYDFLINISVKIIADEIQILELGGRDIPAENKGEVIVDIYDLNLLEKSYSHSVTGKVYATKNSQDVVFTKTTKMIIISGFEKIIKKIKRNQIED